MRERLSNRRDNIGSHFHWPPTMSSRTHIMLGLTRDGRPLEVFLRGGKSGSERDALLDDIAVLLSLLLQHGVTPEEIGKSLGWRAPVMGEIGRQPCSVVTAALMALLDLTSEEAPA